jgi:hypothetical protein
MIFFSQLLKFFNRQKTFGCIFAEAGIDYFQTVAEAFLQTTPSLRQI